MIAIIDYDAGNIRSVEKALLALGQDVTVTADRDEILHADKVILPGVVIMSTYEELMVILTTASLIVLILNYTHKK